MASRSDKHLFCRSNPPITLRQILVLQAHIRGFIVRHHMRKIRTEFEEIIQEIHPDGNLHVVWERDLLCLPEISSKKESCCKPFQLNSKPHKFKPELLTKQENHSISGNFNKNSSNACSNFPNEFPTSNSLNKCSNSHTSTGTTELYSIQGIHIGRSKELHRDEELVEKDENHFREDSIEAEQPKKERKISLPTDSIANTSYSDTDFERKTRNHLDHFSRNEGSLPRNTGKEQFMKNGNGKCTAPFCLPISAFTPLDCSSLTDVTSVWDSVLSSPDDTLDDVYCSETTISLLQERQNLAMELVWIQQAISSRKNYLQLKSQIEI